MPKKISGPLAKKYIEYFFVKWSVSQDFIPKTTKAIIWRLGHPDLDDRRQRDFVLNEEARIKLLQSKDVCNYIHGQNFVCFKTLEEFYDYTVKFIFEKNEISFTQWELVKLRDMVEELYERSFANSG